MSLWDFTSVVTFDLSELHNYVRLVLHTRRRTLKHTPPVQQRPRVVIAQQCII